MAFNLIELSREMALFIKRTAQQHPSICHCAADLNFYLVKGPVCWVLKSMSGALRPGSGFDPDEKLQNEMWGLPFLLQNCDCKVELLRSFN